MDKMFLKLVIVEEESIATKERLVIVEAESQDHKEEHGRVHTRLAIVEQELTKVTEILKHGQRGLQGYFRSQTENECGSWDGVAAFFEFGSNSPGSSPPSSSSVSGNTLLTPLSVSKNVALPIDVLNTVIKRHGLEIVLPGKGSNEHETHIQCVQVKAEEAEHEQQQQQAGQQALLERAAGSTLSTIEQALLSNRR